MGGPHIKNVEVFLDDLLDGLVRGILRSHNLTTIQDY